MAERRFELWRLGTIVPFGLGTWASFAYIGVRLHQRRWLVAAGVYLGAFLAAVVANAVGDGPALVGGAVGLWLGTWVAGLVHAELIHDEVGHRLEEWRAPVVEARRRMEWRRRAREIAERDPALAHEMGIGGGDRDGLVDVNHASAALLATLPGVDDDLARDIVAAREEIDGFSSVFDLGHVLELPAATTELLRERTVFLPRPLGAPEL